MQAITMPTIATVLSLLDFGVSEFEKSGFVASGVEVVKIVSAVNSNIFSGSDIFLLLPLIVTVDAAVISPSLATKRSRIRFS